MLSREEYVEQAYLFKTLAVRTQSDESTQDVLANVRDELLTTTQLPLAVDFLLAELKHRGAIAPAMKKLGHYFTPFQSYIIDEAENDTGRFDMRIALDILHREAEYRTSGVTPQGSFLYEFESISRNRLRYIQGLDAIAGDSLFDEKWRHWILAVRRQLGQIGLAEFIYLHSEYYPEVQTQRNAPPDERPPSILFGAKEGRIALANRRKDPRILFAALHRQLGYPDVPRHLAAEPEQNLIGQLTRKIERLELRLKLIEEEQRGGIDLNRFMRPDSLPSMDDEEE